MPDISSATFISHIEKLVIIPGISGHEDAIIRYMADAFHQHTSRVDIDSIGNVTARFGPDTEKPIAILAHQDTVGLIVNRILSEDTVGVVPVGGVNFKALPGTPIMAGNQPGVIGVRSQHQAVADEKIPTAEQLYIHTASARSVEITTSVTYATQPVRMGEFFASPYLDNRAGCAVLLELARHLAAMELPRPVHLIATVQEETTCAGAYHALQHIQPAAAIFVDGTVSYDTPETRGRGDVALNHGVVLTSFLYVSGLNGWHAHPRLRAHLKHIAAEKNIAYQQDAVHGLMSDARVVTWLAIPSALMGIPLRGKHAPLEIAHLNDLAHTLRLLIEFLRIPLPDLQPG